MSVKRKLFGLPATLLGIALGVVAGALAVAKELFANRFPRIGLTIMLVTPLVAFVVEQVMSRAFPEAYWERIAGNLLKAYRWLTNQSFRLDFVYEIRFVFPPGAQPGLSPATLLAALEAEPGKEPEPGESGSNFVMLGFRQPPFLISLGWQVENDEEQQVTIFTIRMQPEIRDIPMRRAKDDIEGIVIRLNRLQEKLVQLFEPQPTKQAIVDAWLGDAKPATIPIRLTRQDAISGADYQIFPGLLHVAGSDLSAIGVVHRYVGTLEEPPDGDA